MRYVRFCLFCQFQRLSAALLTNQAFAYDFDASGYTPMFTYLRKCLHSVIHIYILYKFIRSQARKKWCAAKGYAMKACRGKEVLLHSFLPSALAAVEWFVFWAGPCSPVRNGPRNPLGRRLVEPRTCLDPLEQRKVSFTHLESNHSCHPARSLVIVQNELCRLILIVRNSNFGVSF